MALYLVICMVLMMNFLVALLSTAYSELTSYRTGLYLKNMVDEQPRWAHHPRFNLFTYRVPPLNTLTLLALPCFVRSNRVRAFVERVQYLPAYFIALAIVLTVDILSLPSAWVKLIKRSVRTNRAKSIFFWTFLFPFVALLICLFDLAVASLKLWDNSSYEAYEAKHTEVKTREPIHEEDLTTLK